MRTESNKLSQELAGIKEEKSKVNQNFQKLQVEIESLKNKHCKETEKLKADLENEIAALTEKLNQQNDESEELKLVKKDLTEQIQKEADLSKKNLQEMKAEKEMNLMTKVPSSSPALT